MSKAIDCGDKGVQYMFYRLQYKITDTDFSNLYILLHVLMIVSQVQNMILTFPIISNNFHWYDIFCFLKGLSQPVLIIAGYCSAIHE